jgi:hypothetical protein
MIFVEEADTFPDVHRRGGIIENLLMTGKGEALQQKSRRDDRREVLQSILAM